MFSFLSQALFQQNEGAKPLDFEEELILDPRLLAPGAANRVVATTGGGAPALQRPATDAPREILRRLKFSENPDILLAAILDECHFLMREVATESAIRAETVQDRLSFVHTALACARTGAKVGKVMAAIQSAPFSDDRRDAILKDTGLLADRVAGPTPESGKQ
jgi:hypothetical protein